MTVETREPISSFLVDINTRTGNFPLFPMMNFFLCSVSLPRFLNHVLGSKYRFANVKDNLHQYGWISSRIFQLYSMPLVLD